MLTCSPKTGPSIMLVIRNVKIMEKGAVYHEEEQVHGGAGRFCSQTRLTRPQCGHLTLALLSLGGIFSLVPQAQVIVL